MTFTQQQGSHDQVSPETSILIVTNIEGLFTCKGGLVTGFIVVTSGIGGSLK